MRHALTLHPDSRCAAVQRIEVEALRTARGTLRLSYRLTGKTSALLLPASAAPARADGLWQHSCFEAFIRAMPEAAYCELNFAPSRRWAAYRFGAYRDGMSPATDLPAPRIEVERSAAAFTLEAALDGLPAEAPWRLGLSAVIEEKSGQKSYWALAHPPGKPDFHHSESFALELR